MSSFNVQEETIWEIFTNISTLYNDIYVEKDNTLHIKSDASHYNICQVIDYASEHVLNLLHNDLKFNINDVRCTQFLQWMCALSMSFSSSPINKLKEPLITNKKCIYNLLDILCIDILQKGLLFVKKETRTKYVQRNNNNNNSRDINKEWLFTLMETVAYDKEHLLTPELVKRLSKTLIIVINLILFIGDSHIVCDYIELCKPLGTVLLYILMQLLGTYILPESIHMKSIELPFHSIRSLSTANEHNNNSNNQTNAVNIKKNSVHMKHNDLTPYISGNKWRMQKSAQITIQFHRLLIKCIWMMTNGSRQKEKVYSMILRHESQRVIMLQLMHFSVLSFECALELFSWISSRTHAFKEKENLTINEQQLLYRLVCNLGVSFVTLCDEYQLEGNEFKVNMFSATLTTEDDDDIAGNRQINEDIIPDSKQKDQYLAECGKKYEAYFSNVVRFANCMRTIYTFHVKKAILIILPLISLCVSVRREVAQRKEVIEFLKELFYVALPQCSYLFIRFQYETQYSIEDMIPILIKSRSGFNRENVFKFYENEEELQANCITSLHIFLYLCDMEGISCKTMIKNLDRTSKREWRNYIQNMSRFIQRFGANSLKPIYAEYDFHARLQSLIEFSKPKKVFSEKRHPNLVVQPLWRQEDDIFIPQFAEHVTANGWISKQVAPPQNSNDSRTKQPPLKKRKLSHGAMVAMDEWPIRNIMIKISRKKKSKSESKSKKRKKRKYVYSVADCSAHDEIYPDLYYSPCLHEIKLLTQWEPAVIKAQKEKRWKQMQTKYKTDSGSENDSDKSLCSSSASDDEYKPPNISNVEFKPRRSKRIRNNNNNGMDIDDDDDDDELRKKHKNKSKQKKKRNKKKRGRKRRRKMKEEQEEEEEKENESSPIPPLPPMPAVHEMSEVPKIPKDIFVSAKKNNMSAVQLISKNAAKDRKLYGQLKNRDYHRKNNNYSANAVIIRQLLTPPTGLKRVMNPQHMQQEQEENVITKNDMNLPDIHKTFQHQKNTLNEENSFSYHNNYNNNINISINNHYSNSNKKKKSKTKMKRKKKSKATTTMMATIDLAKSSESDDKEEVAHNNIFIGNLNSNNSNSLNVLNQEQSLRLKHMLLSNAMQNAPAAVVNNKKRTATTTRYEPYSISHSQPQFSNCDMFKIDPRLNTELMANHLFSCFEKQSAKKLNNDNSAINATLFRILLIAENVNDNVIRIDVDDDEEEEAANNKNGTTHLQQSVYAAIKAIALTNNRYVTSAGTKKIVFTAQMTKEKRVDLILDCYHSKSQLLMLFNRCDNKVNRVYVDSNDANNCTVHNLAKTIIAYLNETKYIILVPKDVKSVNIIVESMIVAHSAIKTQFQSRTNQESYWLYCSLEANNVQSAATSHRLPILGQNNNDPFTSSWLFKIVLNNHH